MATFEEFYYSLPEDSNQRGEVFERIFIPWFLRTDPEWSTKVKEIWLWDEYPERWGKDCGIDLVYEDTQGKQWAVQSKCISPDREISKAEIDSFLSESSDSRIHGRLLIASTDGIGKNAQQVIDRQEKQVVCFLLEHFRHSEVDFPSSPEDLSTGQRKKKRTPRPHQEEAIKNVVEGFQKEDRGQLLMACGTGKTLTTLWIKEALNSKRTLVLLPSLSLLSQTLREWTSTSQQKFNWICVCSDKSVAKQDKTTDSMIKNVSGLGVPVTGDPNEIAKFLLNEEGGVVFATYQSSPLIEVSQRKPGIPAFDIAFADEAHRCAGKISSAFASILDQERIRSKKRLFMTATPRVISSRIKAKADDENIEIASMDDEQKFGKAFHRLNFSDAIESNLLTDYRVIVIGVDDAEIMARIARRSITSIEEQIEIDYEMIANHISVAKSIREYDLRRLITFHSRIKEAKSFAEVHEKITDWLPADCKSSIKVSADYVSGEMPSLSRNLKIKNLQETDTEKAVILSNARCLSEGVDVPTLDGIAFIDPRSSQVEIIQAVGRAIRKSESKKYGHIIIPVYLGASDDPEEEIFESRFKDIWKIILALKSQDDSLCEALDRLRFEIGNRGESQCSFEGMSKILFDLPEKLQSSIGESIHTILVRNTTDTWEELYGQLISFNSKFGHCRFPAESDLYRWSIYQRVLFKRGTLNQRKVQLLESVPSWSWDPQQEKWEKMFEELEQFSDKVGHSRPAPSTHKELFSWVNLQRKNIKNKSIEPERYRRLKALKGWVDNPRKADWDARLTEIKEFCRQNGHSYPDASNSQLRTWAHQRRKLYKCNEIEPEQIEELETIPHWSWSIKDAWQEKYEELKMYAIQNGTSNIPSTIESVGPWVKKQRTRFNAGKLNNDQIKQLEELPAWTWIPLEEEWNKKLSELIEFAAHHGHTRPLRSETKLGQWTSSQRSAYRKNQLSQEKIQKLENIAQWSWDVREQDWEERYRRLKKYISEHDSLPSGEKDGWKAWISWQKNSYKTGTLDEKKTTLLDALSGWEW